MLVLCCCCMLVLCCCCMLVLCCYVLVLCCRVLVLCCCMLVICCCMLAVCLYYAAICLLTINYVDMMYACSLFVMHTHIILSTPFGECDTHKGTAGHHLTRRLFSAPSACVGCRVHNAHAPGWGCGRLALLAPPSKQSE